MNGKTINVLVDFLAVNLAWAAYYWFRIWSGWVEHSTKPDFWIPMLVICGFWLFMFFFFGLYRSWYTQSRLDELAVVFKATVFGALLLFFAIFIDDRGTGSPLQSRLLIVIYGCLIFVSVGGGRLLQHTIQRRLLRSGIGLRNTLIVGWSAKARELFNTVQLYPALGHRIVGFVPVNYESEQSGYRDVSILSSIRELPKIVDCYNVKEVLIALDSSEHEQLLSVVASCNGRDISLKIIPDLYDIISGQARTNQIYGVPLIEITPQLMQPWERLVKRVLDVAVSFCILACGLPVWLLVAIAIKLDSKGPIFYVQKRVGKDEKQFRMIKFRSMHEGAESESGPVWADRRDPRVTRFGKLLRRARIDEVPQLINVLRGEMSLVGPRPERPYFVEQLSKEIPLYKRRLKVRPGITGWAQVKHKYDESIDDVRRKVQYDLSYIENMSLRMDFKILLNTFAVMLLGKGH